MIIEAPKKPLVVSDGNNATDYGYRYGRWEQERDVPPILRGRHLKNHRTANASLVPWETTWADGGSGTHPASRLGLVEDCIFENAGAGYTESLTVDHIQPSSKGGTNHPSNTQLLCDTCNGRKANAWPWSLEAARAELRDEHRLRLKERIESLASVLPADP